MFSAIVRKSDAPTPRLEKKDAKSKSLDVVVDDFQIVSDSVKPDQKHFAKRLSKVVDHRHIPKKGVPYLPRSVAGGDIQDSPLSGGQDWSAVRGLMNQNTIYRFRIADITTINSSSSGNLSTGISFDPSVAGTSDYSNLLGLFDQVLLEQARVQIKGRTSSPESNSFGNCVIGTNLSSTGGSPASASAVVSLTDTILFPGSYIGGATAVRFASPFRPNHVWGNLTSPTGGGVDTGCYGAFQISGTQTGIFAASSPVLDIVFEAVYLLRMRE